jgi:4-diphosphocytidyl-2-C-methyl-D-erythritol kinase
LINPKIQISTREAYLNTPHSKPEKNLEYIYNQDITEWKNDMVNDFEDFVLRVHPQIEECKNILYKAGALFSSMSGSGSTVYGIFEGKPVIPGQIKKYVVYEGLL